MLACAVWYIGQWMSALVMSGSDQRGFGNVKQLSAYVSLCCLKQRSEYVDLGDVGQRSAYICMGGVGQRSADVSLGDVGQRSAYVGLGSIGQRQPRQPAQREQRGDQQHGHGAAHVHLARGRRQLI